MRAAIEALAKGASVAWSESHCSQAHTVMAEGGIAAAMANVDTADKLACALSGHNARREILSNWRMAQIHAQEAPERVRELEQWGALFDRTGEGEILQRAFGGHTFKRLCHVGDRTGLEMIRTLQDRGVHLGIDVFMECAVTRLLKDGERVAGAFGYGASKDASSFQSQIFRRRDGWHRQSLPHHFDSWEYTGDGMAWPTMRRRVDSMGSCSLPTGWLAAGRARHPRHRGGARRGRHPSQQGRERFMQRYDPQKMELSTRDVVARAIYTEARRDAEPSTAAIP